MIVNSIKTEYSQLLRFSINELGDHSYVSISSVDNAENENAERKIINKRWKRRTRVDTERKRRDVTVAEVAAKKRERERSAWDGRLD